MELVGPNSTLSGTASIVNNYGTVTVNIDGAPTSYAQFLNNGTPSPTWNNFGTFSKNTGTNIFYFAGCYMNNSGTLDIQAGELSLYAGTFTNLSGGVIALGTNALLVTELGSGLSLNGGSSLTAVSTNAFRVDQATIYILTTNISIPSLLINSASSSVQQNTNNVIPMINQVAGTWRINVPITVGTYNLSGGELRGLTATITNLNWSGGNLNADNNGDRTIIPPGGTLNLTGSATRYLSYYSPATFARGLDNYGTWNWSGLNSVLGVSGAGVVNNYGSVNITTVGVPGTYAEFINNGSPGPVWNNFGTFTKSPGTNLFYFVSSYVNNSGTMDIQSGQLSFYGVIATNLSTGVVSLGTDVQWINEQNGTTTLNPGSRVTAVSTNSVRIDAVTLYVNTTNLSVPSLFINSSSASVQQNTNNVIPTINQNSGVWRLNVPTTVATYNFTNGELRGANLVVTNFNWLGGALNADGAGSNLVTVVSNLNISSPTVKSMSYYTAPGRTLINNGIGGWSGAVITGSGAPDRHRDAQWKSQRAVRQRLRSRLEQQFYGPHFCRAQRNFFQHHRAAEF